jgi:anti-sigma-K factor RskA
MIPDDPVDRDALAGEYVLGVLDAAATQEVEAALATDEALRRAVDFWEAALDPLTRLADPADPPPDLWRRIERRIASPRRGAWHSIVLWRAAALVFVALAACLAAYVLWMPSRPTLVALLHAPAQEGAAWVAEIREPTLTLRAVTDAQVPADRDLELWGIPAGEAKPRPLGVITVGTPLVLQPRPVWLAAGATLAISVEPKGGSPSGQPTGAIVFVGSVAKLP